MRDRFVNPRTGAEYIWAVSHDEENETALSREITERGTTGRARVLQEAPGSQAKLHWMGKILHRAQLQQFYAWWKLCDDQTIYLYDFDGQGYEVQITSFTPKRVRKLGHTGRDPSMPYHYYTYDIEFIVYRFIEGDAATAGIAP